VNPDLAPTIDGMEGRTMSHVLFATDGSAGAALAEALVAAIAWPPDTAFDVVCVIPREPGPDRSAWRTARETPVDLTERRAVGVTLTTRAAARIAAAIPGCAVSSCVVLGGGADAIGRAADATGADLIVLGSHGLGDIEGRSLGSVAAAVADDSRRPVLVARTATLARTLIADDGSSGSAAAIAYLAAHPWLLGREARLVAIIPCDEYSSEALDVAIDPVIAGRVDAMQWERYADAAELLSADAARLGGTGCGTHFETATREGLPGLSLVAEADHWRSDVVVAGSRARPGGQRSPFGSVGRYVAQNAGCSVLLVPKPVAA